MESPDSVRALSVVIVDDEPLARDCIRIALEAYPRVEVLAECVDGPQAIDAIRTHRPDLVFLDVQMPGLSGFDVVSEIGVAEMPAVVFVSAFDAHALRAFEVHAVDYILKPFDDARFAAALSHVSAQIRLKQIGEAKQRLASLLENVAVDPLDEAQVEESPDRVNRFVVREGERICMIRAEDVEWFEASSNYVRLHLKGKQYRVRVSLRVLADRLDQDRFRRIHKSIIVNLDNIKEVQPWFGGDYVAILKDGKQLRVSRHYAHDLLTPLQ